MALGGEVINLIRLRLLDDPNEVGSVRQVSVVHGKAQVLLMQVLIKMIDPPSVERGRAPLQAMHDIALIEQEFGKVRSILPGDSSNQCNSFRIDLHPSLFGTVRPATRFFPKLPRARSLPHPHEVARPLRGDPRGAGLLALGPPISPLSRATKLSPLRPTTSR